MRSCLALAALLVLPVASPGHAGTATLETDTQTFTITKDHRVSLEFPIGQLRVIATDESKVHFTIRVRCKGGNSEERCEELANQLVLDSRDTGEQLELSLENYPKWHNKGFTVMGELRVPRSQKLRIEMGVGQLDVDGLQGDLDVDLGVGEADIRTLRAHAANVTVETGIGDASIRGADSELESSRFIGARASWSGGKGKSDVRLHVGVGDGMVRLQ